MSTGGRVAGSASARSAARGPAGVLTLVARTPGGRFRKGGRLIARNATRPGAHEQRRDGHNGADEQSDRGGEPEGWRRQDDDGRLTGQRAGREGRQGAARRPGPAGLPDLLTRARPRLGG